MTDRFIVPDGERSAGFRLGDGCEDATGNDVVRPSAMSQSVRELALCETGGAM